MGAMRRATAVRRLRTVAERCQQVCDLWAPGTGLVGVQTFGAVLDPADEDGSIEVIQLALVVTAEPGEVTWGSRPPTFSGLPYVLDLEKSPVDWYFRPAGGPVSNHRIVRPLPIWSREGGVHGDALAALATGSAADLERLREPAPRAAVLRRQLGEELAAAGAHLAQVRDQYWARSWRQAHHTAGMDPESFLWDAVNGYLDLISAGTDGEPAWAPEPEREPVVEREPEPVVEREPERVPEPESAPVPELELPAAAALSPAGPARRTRRAAGPARPRGSRAASPDS
jgi:hypothetical protein